MASLLFVLEPIELCGCSRPPDSASLLDSKGQGAWRRGPSVTNGGAWPRCCTLLQRGRPCLPAHRDVCRGPVGRHTWRENPSRRRPSQPTPLLPLTAPPPPSIQGRSFQQVFQRANKEAPSILKCAMSEKVKVAGGRWGMESRKGGRVRFQKGLESPSEHRTSRSAYVKYCCTKLKEKPNVKIQPDAEEKEPLMQPENKGCATTL